MDYSGKRISSAILAVFFAVVSVVFPVSVHAATYNAASNLTGRQWAVPATSTGVAGAPIVAAAATMLGRANPWIAAISLGTPIMQYLLEKKSGGNVVVVPRNAPQPVNGPGWTNGVPAATQQIGYMSSGYYGATAAAACDASMAMFPTGGVEICGSHWEQSGSTCYVQVRSIGATNCPGVWNWGITQSCPSGYTSSQGYCTLTDPWSAKWPADGVATVTPKADGTGLEPHPQDPDPVPSTPTLDEIQNPTNNYSADPYGNPTSTTIQPQSGGGFKIDQRVQTTSGNQTTTTINNITVNNAGNVTNIFTTTVPGTIDLASPTATPVSSGGTSIQFPTDYNRESTQQQVQQKLDDIKQGTGAAEAPDYQVDQKKTDLNQAITDKAEAIPGQYSGDKDSWFSWVWTPPVGSCSPWVSSIHGQTVTWDVCPYIAKVRDVIGYLLAVLSAAAVYSQLFRRDE